ncbi:hypothetical protein [Flavobacterium aquidurense]|uniref:hypothetical protein n=1 Tax=Flavobacterium aquidurense TaxID=362413 RepID=UPI0037147C01
MYTTGKKLLFHFVITASFVQSGKSEAFLRVLKFDTLQLKLRWHFAVIKSLSGRLSQSLNEHIKAHFAIPIPKNPYSKIPINFKVGAIYILPLRDSIEDFNLLYSSYRQL